MSLTLFGQIKAINCVSITVIDWFEFIPAERRFNPSAAAQNLHLCDDGGTEGGERARERKDAKEEGEFVTVHPSA